jgi:hypothetical protein
MRERVTTLEVAIVGSGFGFREILPAILRINNVKVFLVRPRDYTKSKYREYDLPSISFCSLDEIIARTSIKIVFLAVPPFLQLSLVEKIAPTGKAIYLEKPGGLNSSEAVKIRQLSEDFRNNLYLGFQFRYDPILLFLKSYMEASVGLKIEHAKVNWKIKKSKPKNDWKQNIALGGGVYRDHLCHIVDLLRSNFRFLDDCFSFSLEPSGEGVDFLDNLHLKSKHIQIEINRKFEVNSSLQVEFTTQEEVISVKTQYPFRLRDYSLTQNDQNMKLPNSIDLNQDARRYALYSYIQSVLIQECSDKFQAVRQGFPTIDDAIFTQQVSDRINPFN